MVWILLIVTNDNALQLRRIDVVFDLDGLPGKCDNLGYLTDLQTLTDDL
jgi:hypothetical protein